MRSPLFHARAWRMSCLSLRSMVFRPLCSSQNLAIVPHGKRLKQSIFCSAIHLANKEPHMRFTRNDMSTRRQDGNLPCAPASAEAADGPSSSNCLTNASCSMCERPLASLLATCFRSLADQLDDSLLLLRCRELH